MIRGIYSFAVESEKIMSEKSVPDIIQDRIEESGIEIMNINDSSRGMKILAEGSINQAERIVEEFEYSSVQESDNNQFVVNISDHIFE